jgi:predicted nucleic acid-binding protein
LIVIDASIATKWLSNEPDSAAAARLLERDDSFVAPDIILAETANALWKKQRAGDIDASGLADAIAALLAIDLVLVRTGDLLKDAAILAASHRHPVYDCLYLALARREGAMLATADLRLARLSDRENVKTWRPDGPEI